MLKIKISARSKIVIEKVSLAEIKEKFCHKKKQLIDSTTVSSQNAIAMHRGSEMGMRPSIFDGETYPANVSFLRAIRNRFSVNVVMFLIFFVILLLNMHYLIFLRLYRDSNDNIVLNKLGEKLGKYPRKKNSTSSLYNFTEKLLTTNLLGLTCYAQESTPYEYFLQVVWIWMDLSVYSLIPFITNMICSLIIIVRVRKLNQNYTQFLMNKMYEYNKKNYERKIKKNHQICLMLLNTNLYFFISMLQFWIFFYFFRDSKDQIENLIYLYVYIILYTNNAIDFVIYSLSSQKYRQEAFSIRLLFRSNQPI